MAGPIAKKLVITYKKIKMLLCWPLFFKVYELNISKIVVFRENTNSTCQQSSGPSSAAPSSKTFGNQSLLFSRVFLTSFPSSCCSGIGRRVTGCFPPTRYLHHNLTLHTTSPPSPLLCSYQKYPLILPVSPLPCPHHLSQMVPLSPP